METRILVVELTEKQLKVLEMRYSGLRITEIANKLNTSSANVSKILRQSRRKISGIRKTIEVLRTLGLAKDSAEIELTDKGNELLEKWRRSRSIWKKPPRVMDLSLSVPFTRDTYSRYRYMTDYFARRNVERPQSYDVLAKELEAPLAKIIQEQFQKFSRTTFEQQRRRLDRQRVKPSTIYT